jgi:hypothetical protein
MMPVSLKNYYGGQQKNNSDIALICFKYKNQIQIYHWQTKSFARHKGADVLLESLDNFLDTFMEVHIGKYGRPDFVAGSGIPLSNMTDEQAVTYLNEMVDYFTNELPKYLDTAKDTDLLNIRDEILSGINKVKYLFTLV